jgi:hypothetical protein
MIYLADWKSAVERGHQITSISWVFSHYGPYVDDVINVVRQDPMLEEISTKNPYGDSKALIRVKGQPFYPTLDSNDERILDHVIKATSPKNWDEFIQLVYSTYPILTQPRFSKLDLVALATRFRCENGMPDPFMAVAT